MAGLPVFCPKCQSIFPSRAFDLSRALIGRLELSGCTEPCPVCGFSRAEIGDGVFTVRMGLIEVVTAPDITRQMIEAFREIAERAASGKISKEEAVSEALHISPAFSNLIDNVYTKGSVFLTLLFSFLSLYLQYVGNTSSSADNEKFLQAINTQTLRLESFFSEVSQQREQKSVEQERDRPSEAKATKKPSPTIRKSKPRKKLKRNEQKLTEPKRD
jgi:hypothetical protein